MRIEKIIKIKVVTYGLAVVSLLLLCLILSFVDDTPEAVAEEKITGVVRVLMHEPRDYTLLTQMKGSSNILQRRCVLPWDKEVVIVSDVPANEPMWAVIKFGPKGRYGDSKSVTAMEIHIHSADDINGAGWNHGKRGRGQTLVLE